MSAFVVPSLINSTGKVSPYNTSLDSCSQRQAKIYQASDKILLKSNIEHVFNFVPAPCIKRKSKTQVFSEAVPARDANLLFCNKVQPLSLKQFDNEIKDIQGDKRLKVDLQNTVSTKKLVSDFNNKSEISYTNALMSSSAPSSSYMKPCETHNDTLVMSSRERLFDSLGSNSVQVSKTLHISSSSESDYDDDINSSTKRNQDVLWAELYESSLDDEVYSVSSLEGEEKSLLLAECELSQILESSISKYGRHDYRIIPVLLALVPLRVELRDFSGAEALYRLGLELVDTVPTSDERLHWRQELRIGLSTLLTWQGGYREAELLIRRIIIDFEHPSYLGPDNVHTLLAVRDLALLLTKQAKFSAAAEQYQRLLIAYSKWLGPDHPYSTTAANDLAVQLIRRHKLPSANTLLERIINSREKALGPDHPDTLIVIANLGALRHMQGRIVEANALYRRALYGMGFDIDTGFQDSVPMCAYKVSLNLAKLLFEEDEVEVSKKLKRKAIQAKDAASALVKNTLPSEKEVLQSCGSGAVLPSFPKKGVTLRFVQKVRDYVRSQEEVQTRQQERLGLPVTDVRWTTADVCNRLIKPLTECNKSSLDDLMRQGTITSLPASSEVRQAYDACFGDLAYQESFGDEAHIFVSHAWSCYFCEFVQAIETYFVDRLLDGGGEGLAGVVVDAEDSDDRADPNSTLLWIDLFVNDQWNAPSLPYEWWSGTFLSAIKEIGHTMLVLSPWDAPIPLTRAWCLWEILSTIRSGARLTVQLSSNQRRLFQAKLREDYEYLMTAFCRIDVKNSLAWKSEDREMIFKAVERYKGGFGGVNNMIMEKLRDWVERSARMLVTDRTISECDAAGSNTYLDSCLDKVSMASVLHIQDKLAEAEEKYKEAIADLRGLPCTTPTDYYLLTTKSKLASLYRQQSRSTEAARLYYEVLEGFRRSLGDDHLDTLRTCSHLASLIRKERHYDEALSLYSNLLEGFKKAHSHDHDHPDILATLRNIANIHADQGSYDLARAIFQTALTGYERRLGESHVETLKTVQFTAILLQKQCFYKEAEKMYSRALVGFEKALGPRHPETVKIKSNLESLKSYFVKNPYSNFIVDSNFADK